MELLKNYGLMLFSTVKKVFDYSGRATRKEFWGFILAAFIVNFLLAIFAGIMAAIADFLGIIFLFLLLLVYIAEIVITIPLAVRRLHDINLSGFWLLYLSPFGMPLIYVVYLLGVDQTCDKIIENNKKVGSAWLGWILTWLLWPLGSCAAQFLLFIFAGKKEDNAFGPNPYA